jgi:hypothetical protein
MKLEGSFILPIAVATESRHRPNKASLYLKGLFTTHGQMRVAAAMVVISFFSNRSISS